MPPLERLAKVCQATRAGGPEDSVKGVVPACVAAPGTVTEASELMRTAAEHDLTTVPRGAGTRLHWGPPPARCDLIIDTRRLDRVIEHTAGDLIVKVEAGVTMERLRAVLAGHGQELALDTEGTVGGVIATAAAGPRRLLYGSPRDLLIGITIVRADGILARAGGKVVKNVAGYDLGKLFAGSRGTLGLIVEATFRLHPLPRTRAYTSTRADDPQAAHTMVQALLHSPLVPAAIEADRPGTGDLTVTALFEGIPEGVAMRAESARERLGAGTEISDSPPPWWGRLPEGEILVKITKRPADLPGVFAALTGSGGSGAQVRGSAGNGIWHVGLPAHTPAETITALLSRLRTPGGSAVVLTAPKVVEDEIDPWGPIPGLALMRRVKDQFDPEHRLSPGRFAGGI